MFHLLSVNNQAQLDGANLGSSSAARKIADFVVKPDSSEKPFEVRYKVKGVYLSEKKTDAQKQKILDISEGDQHTFFPHLGRLKDQIHRIIVSGRSGSGKSTVISWLMDEFALEYPECQQIIVSFVSSDPVLDRPHHGKSALRLNLAGDELFDIGPEFFKDSVVIWDDIEFGVNKQVVKFLLNLRATMMQVSRHYNTNMISVSHELLGGQINKTVKSEATGVFLFPAYNQPHQSREYLKKYVGLDKNQITEIMTSDSRWVYINLNSPSFYITEKKVKLLV